MRAQRGYCTCHTTKELVEAGMHGIDLHQEPGTEPWGATPIALNNDAALAAIATGGTRLHTSPTRPEWATNFAAALNEPDPRFN